MTNKGGVCCLVGKTGEQCTSRWKHTIFSLGREWLILSLVLGGRLHREGNQSLNWVLRKNRSPPGSARVKGHSHRTEKDEKHLPQLSPSVIMSSLCREWTDWTAWSRQPCLTSVLVFLGGSSNRPVAGWFSSHGFLHGLCLWSCKNMSSLLNLAVISWR